MLLKAMLQKEPDYRRSVLSKDAHQIIEKPQQDDNAWYVVATDGSTSVIRCKSSTEAFLKNQSDRAVAQNDSEFTEDDSQRIPDPVEPGVDLSNLDVEKETASKLIAGMKAVASHCPGTKSQAEISMPSAMTDLKEIFKTDRVCMVNRPKNASI
jgi:hypothetical protein